MVTVQAEPGPGSDKPHRNTLFLEQAEVIRQTAFPQGQFVLRIHAPQAAAVAAPGSFAHISCDAALPMRRPLSIMRASRGDGWLEFYYKIVGQGLQALSTRRVGEKLSIIAPIGECFRPHRERPRVLLIGGGVGIPPLVFLAETLLGDAHFDPFLMMGAEIPFPFDARPSAIMVPGIPAGVIASMPLMESWGIPSRLASRAGFPGCYDGVVTELARVWLSSLDQAVLAEVEMFACGPTAMLEAAARVARDSGIPCQVCLEEFMVCAVGGCAGCTVLVRMDQRPAMKRVCVDGPVFDAASVFFELQERSPDRDLLECPG